MDLVSLKSFLEVANTQSFSQAAQQLHVTQPAISKRIANLEAQLNCSLFERTGHSVVLSNEGQIFLAKAQAIVLSMENCLQEMKNLRSSVQGKLKLGLSHYIGLLRIPPVLNRFAQLYPQVELDVHFYDSESAQEDILQGLIDIAVVTLPKTLNNNHANATAPTSDIHKQSKQQNNTDKRLQKGQNPDLEELSIWQDELVFVAHKSHPLSKKNDLSLDEIANYPAILPGMDTFTGQMIANQFSNANIELQASHPTNNLENIKVMVSTGFMPACWSVLPSNMIDNKALRQLNIKNATLIRELGCLRSKKRIPSNAAQAFIDLLTSQKEI